MNSAEDPSEISQSRESEWPSAREADEEREGSPWKWIFCIFLGLAFFVAAVYLLMPRQP